MCITYEPEVVSHFDDILENYGEENGRACRCIAWLLQIKVVEEVIKIGKIAWPLVISSLLMYSKSIISMLFLGHLGEIELAGGTLALGFANITGFSVIKGLAMGMEPICCQAFGAKKWSLFGQTYENTLYFLLLASIPISLVWLYVEPIFLFLGQDPNITRIARLYITYSIPELLAQAHLHPLRISLRTQNLVKPITISATFAMILHLPINFFLALYLNLGVKGVALASFLNTTNMNLGLVAYLVLSRTAVKPWNREDTDTNSKGFRPVLVLMLPSVLSVCLEWWFYEIMIVLCGLQDNPKASVAAMGILIQTTGLLYVIPHSLSMSISNCVGQELGAGEPEKARRVSTAGVVMAAFCGLVAFALTIGVRNWWGKVYTSEGQVIELVAIGLPIVGLCEIGNCPQTAACGVVIGCARPKMGACINFGAFYLVGLPVATLMAFKSKMGFAGLWFGLAAAQASCMCMMIYALLSTDWKHQAERAKELTHFTQHSRSDLEAHLLK